MDVKLAVNGRFDLLKYIFNLFPLGKSKEKFSTTIIYNDFIAKSEIRVTVAEKLVHRITCSIKHVYNIT